MTSSLITMNRSDLWFLDLEGTIITNWNDPVLENFQTVKDHFKRIGVSQVGIFSFAIRSEKDKERFQLPDFKPWLERVYELEFMTFPSVDEMVEQLLWKSGDSWAPYEFVNTWGKAKAFRDYCNLNYSDYNCFLIDDVVADEIVIDRRSGRIVETINVKSLSKWESFVND